MNALIGRLNIPIALLTVVGIVAHLVLRFGATTPQVFYGIALQDVPLLIVLVVGGVPLVISLGAKLFAKQFGSDLLAGISIVTSLCLHEYLAGVLVVMMLSGGAALEEPDCG